MSGRARFLVVAAAALLMWSCGSESTQTGVLELRIGTVDAPGSLLSKTTDEFVSRVNQRLQGRVHLTAFGSSQLGSDEVMLQKLKLGTLDFAVPSTIMSSEVPEFGLFEMPYLVDDREHMRRIGDEIFWPRIAPRAEEKGYRILGLWENGFRHITNNTRPIRTPRDLAGIKLRTPKGAWRVKLFQTFGANPTPMPFGEIFVALQTGVIDGQENPLAQLVSLRLDEVQKYLSLTGHVYTPAYLTTGADRWNRLPEDVRRVIEQTGREIQDFAYTEAARMDAELLERLRASRMEINDADRNLFFEASKPIYDEFSRTVPGGGEMIQAAIRLRDR